MNPKILKELQSYKNQEAISNKQIELEKDNFIKFIRNKDLSDIKNNDSYSKYEYTLWERIKKVLNIT
jgi:hypothetical protein